MQLLLSLLLMLFMAQPAAGMQDDAEQRLLQRGLEAEEQGNYQEALQIWTQARAKLSEPSLLIGREYIRLATEHLMTKQYRMGCFIYLWGISDQQDIDDRSILEKEFSFVRPLLSDEEADEWGALLKENPGRVYKRLRDFWNSLDPTPFTEYNERLVEHWERIAFARKSFNRGEKDPYGTDDRGIVYVRYGVPDHKKDGIVEFNQLMVESWVADILSRQVLNPRFIRTAAGREQVRNVTRDIRLDFTYPEYEIWVYRELADDTPDNTLFIFGEDPNTGSFGRIETLDELIPNTELKGVTGVVKQLLLYDHVTEVDNYFGTRLVRLESAAMTPGTVGLLPQQKKFEHRADLLEVLRKSPDQKSKYEEQMSIVPLDVYQYRSLGEDNRPYLTTMMESSPGGALVLDYRINYRPGLTEEDSVRTSRGQMTEQGDYQLVHGYKTFDEDRKELDSDEGLLPIGEQRGERSLSIFRVPHIREHIHQLFVAELHNYDPQSRFIYPDMPFEKDLRGLGKVDKQQPEPLNTEPSKLEMGDLVVGYDLQESAGSGKEFPFHIANDRRIPVGEELVVHLEVYHLQQDPGGNSDLSIRYEILPVNFIGWTQERKKQMQLTLNFQTERSRFLENLEIKTQQLESGRYVLRMKAIDQNNSQTVDREVEFNVYRKD